MRRQGNGPAGVPWPRRAGQRGGAQRVAAGGVSECAASPAGGGCALVCRAGIRPDGPEATRPGSAIDPAPGADP